MSKTPIVVIGASSGFGAALAKDLARRGHIVMAGARTPVELGNGVIYRQVDVTSEESVSAFFKQMKNELPVPYGFVYCPSDASAVGYGWDVPIGEVEHVLDVSFLGFVRCIQHIVPAMRQAGRGSVLAIGSRGARVPVDMLAAYCAAKAALEQHVRCLAEELADTHICVNALGIAAETPLAREHLKRKQQALGRSDPYPPLPDARDNLPFARFLLTPEAQHISGQVMDARPPAWT
ncbi:SDR family NAD(P)-dependent oxidoreductase [Streptomyces coacervatus]|uniref:SDR family NAD(P)-dependent oxidoreductase n=1 Tax=Streptomyces coacervatus TaxID=647381 RepID=A0ABP7HKM1_9ACTN|nr:SDR family oxidoreductase [Streptomyces coacervatus]MDF2272065.1 SDR family NAD(P)-dependent oxidoreductase [Streptomyces coacervatus]